jgi:hypothetical protein
MTTPTQDRAGRYLKQVLGDITDDPSPETATEVLLGCSRLADQDLAECLTNQQKQKVWAALLSAVSLVIRIRGGEGIAANTLKEALTNASLGRPGDHGLTSLATPNTQPLDQEWPRACMIALVDEYPSRRNQTYKDAVGILGVSEASLKKFRENYRGGKVGGNVLINLVGTAKSLIKENGWRCLADLLSPKPPPRA